MNKNIKNIFYGGSIAFVGTGYCGWQKQKDQRTVQGELERALRSIFQSKEVRSIASGRTDAGVHAQNLRIKIEAPFLIPARGLERALNSFLPPTIVVSQLEETSDFRPTFDAKSRDYFYLFTTRRTLSPFESPYIAQFPAATDIELLKEALQLFVGTKDFKNFMSVGTPVASTVRTISRIDVLKENESFHGLIGDHWRVSISGSGFLKQMIRLMMGAALDCAKRKERLVELSRAFDENAPRSFTRAVPPQGLFKAMTHY